MDELILTDDLAKLSKTSSMIVTAARERGIGVRIRSVQKNRFELSWKGQKVICSDALTDRTTKKAFYTAADKYLTTTLLARAGFSVPAQQLVSSDTRNRAFLRAYERIVIKPLSLSSGQGVSVDIQCPDDMNTILKSHIKKHGDILMEEFVQGVDLRILIIDNTFVAAIHRAPPHIIGNGKDSIATLIRKKKKYPILVDQEAKRCLASQGYALRDVPPKRKKILVRKNTNESTGGVPTDVTNLVHPDVRKAAIGIARHLDIPVAGIDFMMPSIRSKQYMFIEANSSPGLYGHEPQPVIEHFLNYLFGDESTVSI